MYEIRNARYDFSPSLINLEWNHPEHGWIEYSAYLNDEEVTSKELYEQAILGEVAPYVAPPEPTPEEKRALMPSLTARQFRLGLLQAELLTQVQGAINSLPEPQKSAAQIEFDYSSTFERLNPTLLGLTTALGLSSEQVDELWETALEL